MKTGRGIVVVGVACLMFAQPSWAVRTSIHDAADSPAYGRKFGGMIGRGVLNVATSFVDLLVNVVNETQSGAPLVGTLVGIGKGAGCMSLRILSGATDLVTFWVPGFNGFPVSDSYENCLAVTSPAQALSSLTPPSPTVEPVAPPSPVTVWPKTEQPRYTK